MNNQIKVEFVRPFGPVIGKVNIPTEIIKKLNNYFEETTSSEEKLKKFDYGNYLVGNVTKEIRIDPEFAKESGWLTFLGNCTKAYIHAGNGRTITKFQMIDSWIVSQYQHEYNPTHWHGGHLSGAGYIKLPNTFGSSYQKKDKYNYNGNLQLIHGSRQFLSDSLFTIKPILGEFYFFPNYLMHTVFPFKDTDQERRCVSFNAYVDDEIYNVYGN